jgi:hypothetical protein
MSASGRPVGVLGSVETVADLHVAFSHSGATLGLTVGELLAKEIASGNPPHACNLPRQPFQLKGQSGPMSNCPDRAAGLGNPW